MRLLRAQERQPQTTGQSEMKQADDRYHILGLFAAKLRARDPSALRTVVRRLSLPLRVT